MRRRSGGRSRAASSSSTRSSAPSWSAHRASGSAPSFARSRRLPVGAADDDPRLARRRLQGVPVLGGLMEIEPILSHARPDTVLVTIPDAPHERLGLIIDACTLD